MVHPGLGHLLTAVLLAKWLRLFGAPGDHLQKGHQLCPLQDWHRTPGRVSQLMVVRVSGGPVPPALTCGPSSIGFLFCVGSAAVIFGQDGGQNTWSPKRGLAFTLSRTVPNPDGHITYVPVTRGDEASWAPGVGKRTEFSLGASGNAPLKTWNPRILREEEGFGVVVLGVGTAAVKAEKLSVQCRRKSQGWAVLPP